MKRLFASVACLLALAGRARAEDLERTLPFGGRERSYLLHVPELTTGDPLPLVVVLHGAGGDAGVIRDQSGFSAEADWRGFAVVYPNGLRGPVGSLMGFLHRGLLSWNAGACCGWPREHAVDDVGFVRAVVEDVARVRALDHARLYAAGMSNGGMLAYRLACEASDLFAAVGVVSGALALADCAPAQPVSVVQIHGTADEIVPIDGGPGQTVVSPGWVYPSAESTLELWRDLDGCDPAPRDSRRGTTVRVRRYSGCRNGTEVDGYTVEGGKHAWTGGGADSLLFVEIKDLVATETLWSFFASHPKPR